MRTFLLLLALTSAASAQNTFELRGKVVDAVTGETLPARVTVRGPDGKWHFPRSASAEGSAVDYRKDLAGSPSMHVTLSAHPFTIRLPAGKYTLTAERGKEYIPVVQEVTLGDPPGAPPPRARDPPGAPAPVAVDLPLRRWIHMTKRGWYSGDTHNHRALAETPNLVLAEDLNVACPITYWVTDSTHSPAKLNRTSGPPPKPESIRVDDDHLIYPMNTEYEIFTVKGKRHTLGAVVIVGHKRPFDMTAPPVEPVAKFAREDGALIDLEKHSWAWSLMLVPVMKVDLFELANNHVWPGPFMFKSWTFDMNPPYMKVETDKDGFTEWGWIDYGFQTYYALLNCGHRVQPTAGTASGVHPVPLGFGRVYVEQPDGFSYEKWMAGLKAGRSFVTTGPMLLVKLNDQPAGHVFTNATPGGEYRLTGTVESIRPIGRVEIIVSGRIVKTLTPKSEETKEGGHTAKLDATIPLEGSAWLAVRVFEPQPDGRFRYAHSSPFHIEVPGKPVRPRAEEIDYIVGHLKKELARNKPVLAEQALREFEAAIEAYEKLRE